MLQLEPMNRACHETRLGKDTSLVLPGHTRAQATSEHGRIAKRINCLTTAVQVRQLWHYIEESIPRGSLRSISAFMRFGSDGSLNATGQLSLHG